MAYSPLTDTQIQRLADQGCSAGDWNSVSVEMGTDISRIRHVQFIGIVSIGINKGSIVCDGIELPCGLYDATIARCEIGDNVRIANIGSAVVDYRIESDVLIQNVGALVADEKGNFGNGIELKPINEGGGRGTILHNDLTAQSAFLQAAHRHDRVFTAKLHALVELKIQTSKSRKGFIGTGARVVHCGPIRNVNIGPYASIHGAAVLENGTILSCRDHPTEVGDNVNADSFILSEGAAVTGGVILDKVFVGQGTRLAKQFSAENSLFFANCEGFHGEAVSLFCGPYTVTHHKSTLLIAGLFSFFNAGSGTNQSNHMYKLGPVHQGVFERGSKTGSFAYVMYETHLGPFSVIIGKHYTNIDTPDLPFSYIREDEGVTKLLPGRNLFSVGLMRDEEKWRHRDNRRAPKKRDCIIGEVFTPYTVEKMRRGRKVLLELSETSPPEKTTVQYGGVHLGISTLRKGAEYYTQAIVRYLAEKVCTRLIEVLEKYGSWKKAAAHLTPAGELKRPAEWTDLAGLIAPQERVLELEADVRSGTIDSHDELLRRIESMEQAYHRDEWEFVSAAFTEEFGIAPHALSKSGMVKVIGAWIEAASSINGKILEDARREFGPSAMIGYGLDQSEEDCLKDFESVRGSVETNTIVQKLVGEEEEFRQRVARYDELITRSKE